MDDFAVVPLGDGAGLVFGFSEQQMPRGVVRGRGEDVDLVSN